MVSKVKYMSCLMGILWAICKAQNSINEDHEIVLSGEYNFVLKWRVDGDYIFLEISADTNGYLAIGFSENGGMPGADIVAGWVKSGDVFLSDRHATAYSKPDADKSDDYELLYGYEEGGKTTIGFKRKLETCDTDDYVISTDTSRIIWALNDKDPEDMDDLVYHGSSRGVRSVVLINGGVQKLINIPPDAGYFDVIMPNVTVPHDQDTTYMCSTHRLPKFDTKVHIIRFEPLVQKGHEYLVHHLLLFGCYDALSTANANWTGVCRHPNMPPELYNCGRIMCGWAIGGNSFEFPEDVGVSLGGTDDPTYFFIEMHYDNPTLSTGYHDNSGLRIYYTPTIRKYEADTLRTGHRVTPYMLIPPKEKEFTVQGFCPADCTKNGLSEDIHIIAVLLHAHLAARKMSIQQYRNGKLIDDLARDDNYDFNLQEIRLLPKQKTIKPGDDLVVTCTYGTMDRDNITVGGLRTKDEMCLVFLYYYPRQPNIVTCVSYESVDDYFTTFGITIDGALNPYNMTAFRYFYHYISTSQTQKEINERLFKVYNGDRYGQCLDYNSNQIEGVKSEIDFSEWYNKGQRAAKKDVCGVNSINGSDQMRAGNLSFTMMLAMFFTMLFL
ncbi:DBH-like monooxygenase protein 1 homolog [Anneissia japonica]|uniref:DBH-like monooxygenase protein 1 homolog n=1 Tax=Anneissia japonica TaxID=1529436 RepID=UPI00142588C3|nr:DBH-like monooxygenase protein 1 homolog [Anneissia japonica]